MEGQLLEQRGIDDPVSDLTSPVDRVYESWGLKEAAAFLKVHPDTLAQRAGAGAGAGEIPGCKVGRAWVFLPEMLREYLRDRSVTPKARAASQRQYAPRAVDMEMKRLRERRAKRLLQRTR